MTTTKAQVTEKLDSIQTRLDGIKSDPAWLNEDLAELKGLLADLEVGAPVSNVAEINFAANQLQLMMNTKPFCKLMMDMATAQAVGPLLATIPFGAELELSDEAKISLLNQVKNAVNIAGMASVHIALNSNNRLNALLNTMAARAQAAEVAAAAASDTSDDMAGS